MSADAKSAKQARRQAREAKQKELGLISFTISVLWMSGRSIATIATLSGRTKGSVRGIVHRAFPTPREDMSIEQRQAKLYELKAARVDDGRLPEKYFIAGPLAQAQEPRKARAPSVVMPLSFYQKTKPAAPAPLPPPDPRTREGRKEIQRRKAMQRHEERKALKGRERRELGGAARGLDVAALEYLHAQGILADPIEKGVDAPRENGITSRERRKEAGRILRAHLDGCRIGGLTGIDLERVGSGSNSRLAISAYRLQAIHALGAIKQLMAASEYALIEGIVDRDETPWANVPSKQAKAMLYEAIRRALDVVAVVEELMGRTDFAKRWGIELPIVKVMDQDQARQTSRAAEQILRQA